MDEKKYDLFTNMAYNQNFSYDDLISAGLNSNNTELKDKDTYRNSEKVQEMFKNDSGQFDEQKFNNFYNTASSFYNQMATSDYNSSVAKSAIYHRDNIFAPAEQRQQGPQFQMYQTINPWHTTEGLSELGKVSESPFSLSEIAQNNKVLLNPIEAEKDPSKAQWGSAPNDNFMGYFFDSLVLATYDEDVEETDPITGQRVKHVKGEPKISPEGEFYYERLEGRDPYGKQVLNKMNILTKDGSAWNRFDIFDSDDKDNGWVKTILKNTALVGAMFLPYVGGFFRGVSVLTQSVGLLGTLGKIAVGSDSDLFNNMEGWSMSVNRQTARSEYAQQNVWCVENMINLIGDAVAQLAEQRWIFEKGSSLISGADIITEAGQAKKQKQLLDQILKNNQIKIDAILKDPKNIGKAMEASAILTKHAELEAANQLKNLVKSSQNISSIISKAYMTGITVKDMYGEAKAAGASDTDAALLTIGYAAAEYALLSTGLGELVLPELRAGRYRIEAINKALFQKKNEALKSITNQFGNTTTEQAKRAYVSKMIQFGKDIVSGVRVTGAKTANATFAAALGEATEETSEEVLADFMRSCHNISQWLQGKDDYMKAFGYDATTGKFDMDDISSRYGMSFIGGFIGGGVANARMNYKAIHQAISYTPETAMRELVNMTRNNELDEYKKYTNKQILGNPNLSATNYDVVDGKIIWQQGTKSDNQNIAAHKALDKQLEIIQSILTANGAKSDNEFLDTNTLGDFRFMALHNSTTAGAYLNHYNKLNVDLVKSMSELETLINTKADTNNDGVVEDKEKRNAQKDKQDDTPSTERINQQIEQKKKQIEDIKKELQDLQEGKYAYKFIAQSLFEMTTALSSNFTSPIYAIYAERKYHKKYDDLSDEEKQKALDEWKNFSNLDGSIRFQTLTDMYLDIAKKASDVIKQHSEKYISEDKNFGKFDAYLSRIFNFNTKSEEDWIENLSKALADPNEVNQLGMALHNVFLNDELFNLLKGVKSKYKLEEPKVADPKNPTQDEQLAIDAYQTAYESMQKEMLDTYNKYLTDNLQPILQKYIDRGYATQTTKDALLKIIYNRANFLEGNEEFDLLDQLDDLQTKIQNLNRTPFEENLDQFAISVGKKAIKLTDLINKLQKSLNINRNSIESFQMSNELFKELNNALKLISLYKAAIEGAQTDNANLGNLFGFNATLNEVAKKVGDTEFEGLAEIDDSTAQILLRDLEVNYQRLLTIKQLYLYNRGQKLQLQDKVALNFNSILYKKFKYIISILDKEKFKDWEKIDLLKNVITNSTIHQKAIDDKLKTLTQEQEKQYTREQIDIENAVFDVFNSNIDKIQDFIEELDILNSDEKLLTEELDSITDKEFIWYLASRTAVKSEQFYTLYKDVIDPESKKPIAPLITQELGIYNQFASIVNGNIFSQFRKATNNAILNKFHKLSEEDKKKVLGNTYDIYSKSKNYGGDKIIGTLLNLTKFDGFALVEGAAGTGKTKAIDFITVQMLKNYASDKNNPLSHVAIVHGGSKASAIDIQSSINIEKSEAFGKQDFMKMMNPNWKELEWDDKLQSFKIDPSKYQINSQGLFVSTDQAAVSSNPFSLIIIDEIQQFSTFDMDIIMDYANKHNISVVVSGDFDQQGVEASIQLDNSNVYNAGLTEQEFIHSPKLGVIMRTDNELKSQNTIGFQAFMNDETLQHNPFKFNYYEDENGLWGDKVIYHAHNKIEEEDIKELDKLFNYLNEGEKIGFIYDDETSKLYQLLQTEKYKNKVDFKKGSSALGLEARYYIIETNPNSLNRYLKNIYTGITRSAQGSLLFAPSTTTKQNKQIQLMNKRSNELIQEPLPIQQVRKYANKRKTILTEVLNATEKPQLIPRTAEQEKSPVNNQQTTQQKKTYNFATGSVLGKNSNYTNIDASSFKEFSTDEQESLFGELWKQDKINDADIKSFTFIGDIGNGQQRGQAKVIYYNNEYYLVTSKGTAKWNKSTNFWSFAKNNSTSNEEAIKILQTLNSSDSVFRKGVIAVDFGALDKSSSFDFLNYTNTFANNDYLDESGYQSKQNVTQGNQADQNYSQKELIDRFGDLYSSNQLSLFGFEEIGKTGQTPIIKSDGDYYAIDAYEPIVYKWNNGKWDVLDGFSVQPERALERLQEINSLDSSNAIDNAVDYNLLVDKDRIAFYSFIKNFNINKTLSEQDIIQITNNSKPSDLEVLQDIATGVSVQENQQQVDTDNDDRVLPTVNIDNSSQAININSILFSFNTFELGVRLDQNGNPITDESTPYRIDGYNGLSKINPNISVQDIINTLKLLREILLSGNDQKTMENLIKSVLIANGYFDNNSDPYIRFAFKFSAILSKGKEFASKGDNLIYEKGADERSIYNGNNQGDRSGEVNRHTIVAIIGDKKSSKIVEIPLLSLTSPFTLAYQTDQNGSYIFPEIVDYIETYRQNNANDISLHELSSKIVETFDNNQYAKYKSLINLFKLFNVGSNTIVYLNYDKNSFMPNMTRLGPQVSVKRGDYSIAEGFEYDSNDDANEKPISEIIAESPFNFLSAPITLIQDNPNLPVKKGSPIMLFSDSSFYTSDEQIIQRFIEEQSNPSLPKHINYFYINPPKYNIRDYFINKFNIISNNAYVPSLGNPLTTFNILDKIFSSQACLARFKQYFNNDEYFQKIKNIYDQAKQLDNIKDRVGFLMGVDPDEKYSRTGLIDRYIVNSFRSYLSATDEISANLNDLVSICQDAGISEVYVHTTLMKGSEYNGFVKVNSSNYQYNQIPFTARIKLDQTTFQGDVNGMVEHVLKNLHYDKSTKQYWSNYDKSYKQHDCSIRPTPNNNITIDLGYIYQNANTIANNHTLLQQTIQYLDNIYKTTGEYIFLFKDISGKYCAKSLGKITNPEKIPVASEYYNKEEIKNHKFDHTVLFKTTDERGRTVYVEINSISAKSYTIANNPNIENQENQEIFDIINISSLDSIIGNKLINNSQYKNEIEYFMMDDAQYNNMLATRLQYEEDPTDNQNDQQQVIDQEQQQKQFKEDINALLSLFNDDVIKHEIEANRFYQEDIEACSNSIDDFKSFLSAAGVDEFRRILQKYIGKHNITKELIDRLTRIDGACS